MLTVENVRKVAITPSQSLVFAIVVPPSCVPVAVVKPSKYAFEKWLAPPTTSAPSPR